MSSPQGLPTADAKYLKEYRGDGLRDVAIAFTALEVVFVGLRYFSRWIGRKPLGLDDWLIAPGLVTTVAATACAFVPINYGKMGYHLLAVVQTKPQALTVWSKSLIAFPILYAVSISLSKLAILVLLIRIFVSRPFKIIAYIVMAIQIAWVTETLIVTLLGCVPLKALWDQTIVGRCINLRAFWRYGTLVNLITDLVMLVLPMPVIWRLEISRKTKLGLTATFLTGSVGMIAGILRCVAFFRADPLTDGTWGGIVYMQWSVIEPGCCLIAACLPCFRPLLNWISGGRFDPQHDTSRMRPSMKGFSKLVTHRTKTSTVASHGDGQVPVVRQEMTAINAPRPVLLRDRDRYDEEGLVGDRLSDQSILGR